MRAHLLTLRQALLLHRYHSQPLSHRRLLANPSVFTNTAAAPTRTETTLRKQSQLSNMLASPSPSPPAPPQQQQSYNLSLPAHMSSPYLTSTVVPTAISPKSQPPMASK